MTWIDRALIEIGVFGAEDRFHMPWALVLLALLPPLIAWTARRSRLPAAEYSSLIDVHAAGRGIRARTRFIVPALFWIGVTLLIVALARPQVGRGERIITAEGITMMLVIDRSESMNERMNFGGREQSRIEVVKRLVAEFVLGSEDGELEGRPFDRIGAVSFSGTAETIASPSLYHKPLVNLIQNVTLVPGNSPNAGTAIGDGLALAVARLETQRDESSDTEGAAAAAAASEPDDPPNRDTARSDSDAEDKTSEKVIILLTDGEENTGTIRATQAARLAAELGIRMYAIGIGKDRVAENRFGRQRVVRGADQRLLRAIARRTGGQAFIAGDGAELREIYQAIDELEKTEIESVRSTSYRELFPPIAAWGLGAFTLATLLGASVWRRLP